VIAALFNPLRRRSQAFIVMRCVPILLRRGKGSAIRFKVQELLGHATVAITLDTYSHMIPGMGGEGAESLCWH
jgi:integrase